MKKLLLMCLIATKCSAMTDDVCKSTTSTSPNRIINKLNHCHKRWSYFECPFGCRYYFVRMIQDLTVKFAQDLYNDNLVDYETIERELRSLITEKNAEVLEPIIERIKLLKEETNS